MVVCASCLRAIDTRGQQFVLAGTEVFHRSCAGNISNSVSVRQKNAILDAKRELIAANSDARQASNRVAEMEDELRVAREEIRRSTSELRQMGVTLLSLRDGQRTEVNRMTEELAGVRRQRDNMAAQIRELQKVEPPTPTTSEENSDLDDAEKRSRLLELDLE